MTTTEYLVHTAVSGVEKAQRFRRPGVYINLADEVYDAIWFGLIAIGCLIAAILFVTYSQRTVRQSPHRRLMQWPIFIFLLFSPAAFCVWFYRYEFYRLSPDMAGAGLALMPFDWFCGAVLAAFAITVGAYYLAVQQSQREVIDPDLSIDIDRKAYHESFLGLVLLAGSAAAGMYSLASMIASMIETPTFGTFNAGRLLGVVFEPLMLLTIAQILASLQLCWARYRRRSTPVPWMLFGVSVQRFIEGWVMLAILVTVGIPTVRIFAFLMWFGPYNLRHLFGF